MEPTTIDSKSWVAFPIAPLTPTAPDQRKWVAVLAGIAIFELHESGSGWTHDEVRLTLDDMTQAIFTIAQRTPSAGHHLRFVVEHTANAAAINSINSINSMTDSVGSQERDFGFAAEAVETNLIGHTIHCIDGLTIKVAVAGAHAHLLRVGFQSTLTGWIREFRTGGE
jgi:hypothetical protein